MEARSPPRAASGTRARAAPRPRASRAARRGSTSAWAVRMQPARVSRSPSRPVPRSHVTCIALRGRPVQPVAIDAPAHLQAGDLAHHIHGLDRPMAGLTGDPSGDVPAVTEVDVVREPVDTHPGNRLVRLVEARDELNRGAIGADDQMAVHADVPRRDGGVAGTLRVR